MKNVLEINLKYATIQNIKVEGEYFKVNCEDLVFKASELCGYNIVGVNKLLVYSQNKKATSGGNFAHYMKTNGYDYIIIKEKSNKPTYIYIDKKNVYLRYDSLDKNQENKIEIAQIKNGGENYIDFSRIVFSETKSCGKNGLGKIMGEKNLKAIVLHKHKKLMAKKQEEFDRINKILASRIGDINISTYFNDNNQCYGCNLNCKTSVISKIEKIGYDNKTANLINKLSNDYGVDSIIFSKIIKNYLKEKSLKFKEIIDFSNEFICNYNKYKYLYDEVQNKKGKTYDSINSKNTKTYFEKKLEVLGFCKFIIDKKIINENELGLLIEAIKGGNDEVI